MNNNLIEKIKKIVGDKNIIFDEKELEKYNKDWRGYYHHKSICCVTPDDVQQIQELLKYCNENNVKIVPQGGNTGLTGACVPSEDKKEIILNLKKLNKIIKLDDNNNTITLESGCILDDVIDFCEKKSVFFPAALAASGSCQIGGNISTNAGGINVYKYGSIRENIIGLEIILANGKKIDALSNVKKNNKGYDLKSIFCGAEGTLGIITKATLKIYPLPLDYFSTFIATNSVDNSVELFKSIRSEFGNALESCELIPHIAIETTVKHNFLKKSFFKENHISYLLCKFSIFEEIVDFEEKFINKIEKFSNLYEDIIIAQNRQQNNNFWKFREDLIEAIHLEGKNISNDISLPIETISSFVKEASKNIKKMEKDLKIFAFGHLGDGNIHLDFIIPFNFEGNFFKFRDEIFKIINHQAENCGGSFSAEHGIGQLKKEAFIKYKNADEVKIMCEIKKILDPNNILNPGKIFDLK